ncbi:MAG: hypothetical protein WBM62_13750, partial [Crocosphaera sp.]
NTNLPPPYKNQGFSYFASVLAVASVLGSANVAHAATFNFSFSNVIGNTPGTVEGTIELPDGDGTFAATSIVVTSAPAALGYTTPFDVLANSLDILVNSFNVLGGEIDDATSNVAIIFNVGTANGSVFSLGFPGFGSRLGVNGIPVTGGNNGVVDVNDTTLAYSAVTAETTPEPTSIVTLLGVGVLGVASKLKKKA